jgi:hypothetical protein
MIGQSRAGESHTLRVGYQKGGGLLSVLKAQATLEKTLRPRRPTVQLHKAAIDSRSR